MDELQKLRSAVAAYLEPAKCPKLDSKLAIAVIEAAIEACEAPLLTPDRERVAMAIHDANTHGLKGEDVWLARADAAINATEEP